MTWGGFGYGAGGNAAAFSPFIGAQAGATDLAIAPGFASYPAANATVSEVTSTLLVGL